MKFCWNLQHMISQNHQVTSNQKFLFEKFIQKYRKQIEGVGLDLNECVDLPWATKIVESEKKYTGAHVTVNKQKIIVKVPFNSKFIKSLRESHDNYLEWVRVEKHYTCPLNTVCIKFLYENLHKYFATVTFDKNIQSFIDDAHTYQSEIFNPTLVKVCGNFYIAAINSNLYEHIKNIKLNDDARTLFLLSQYGIFIDSEIIGDDDKKLFASSMKATVDIKNAEQLAIWLSEIEVDQVYFYGRTLLDMVKKLSDHNEIDTSGPRIDKLHTDISKYLKKLNIKYSNVGNFKKVKSSCPVIITSAVKSYNKLINVLDDSTNRVWKYIEISNSTPVNIK